MSTLPLSVVNSYFLAASSFPVFFCVFRVVKNALYAALCSASSGNQTTRQPASSAQQSKFALQNCKIWCLVARDKDIPGYRSSGKIHVASLRCTTVPVATPGGGKDTNSSFLCFFIRSPAFSFADVDTYDMYVCL